MELLMFIVYSLLVENTFGQSDPDLLTSVTVTIGQGTVQGSKALDGEYFQFYGIPYADSTSGIHRFKAPRAPPPFLDTFIANRKGIKCVRPLGNGYEGTEDCLVANVFTPKVDSTSKLPVMVWIKGREFDKLHERELSFRNFMEEDVVVVSLSYRESILGFLCLGTETAPGNAGLKDIIAGLKWIKKNIAQFGGNPDDITIFGHGSGGAAVDLITLSPMANGLVNKAIAQSGNAMAPWAVSRDNLKYVIQVAEALGHIISDIEELSQVFTRTSVAALMGVINELDLAENALAFAPCVEREELKGVESFLVKTPSEILASGEFLNIPFITGFVDNEGTIRLQQALQNNWLNRMSTEFENFVQPDLKFGSDDERSQIASQIRQFYFEDYEIDLSNIGDYIAYYGETMILVSSIREARARAQASSSFTYLYQFSYKGARDGQFMGLLGEETATHSEELAYLFQESPKEASSTDLNIVHILVERWTNFAKTGSPTSKTSPVIWQPFTTDKNYYLRFLALDEIKDINSASFEISLVNPHPDTLNFWDAIYSNNFQDAESNWSLNKRDETLLLTLKIDNEGPSSSETDDGDSMTPESIQSTSSELNEVELRTLEPDEEDLNTETPDEEGSFTSEAEEEGSTTSDPGPDEEGSTTLDPGPDEEDLVTTDPGTDEEESSPTDPETDEEESTTSDPGTDEEDDPGTDEEDSSTSAPGPDEGDSNTPGPDEGITITSAPDNDITTTSAPGSASTVVGCTFSILTLFSILNRFHVTLLVS